MWWYKGSYNTLLGGNSEGLIGLQTSVAWAKDSSTPEVFPLDLNTMPGYAGASAYYIRYMDPIS